MDIAANLRAQQYADAQLGLTNAYLDPESPDEAAKRLQKARYFNVSPAAVDAVDPATVAKREAEQVDWAAMQLQAPQLMRRLSDTNFAKVVQDDITNVGALEWAVWKLAPEGGKPNGLWETMRNSGARGAYSIASYFPGIGSIDKLTQYQSELNDIRDKEAAIQNGKTDAELFGSDQDPTGVLGRRRFELDKERRKAALGQLIQQEATTTAWANRMMGYFPQSAAMEKLSGADNFVEAAAAVLENPLEVLANVGPESLTQMAPALPFMAAFGAGMAGMATTFASSAGFDRSSQIAESLSELGIDPSDPNAIAEAFTNPAKRVFIDAAVNEANAHALGTGLFDAASFGIAGKTLLPKKWVAGMSKRGAEFSNTLVQAPVQGAMGAAGEATGQLMSKGEIESWGDVVAEFAGEFFTSPIEVAAAGVKATKWAQDREARAAKNAETIRTLGQALQATKLVQRDPETAKSLLDEVGKSSGVETIYINPVSLQQSGLADQVRSLSPTVAEKFEQALETGTDIAIPMSEYVMNIAPTDDGTIAGIVHTADTPSYQQAQEDAQEVQEAVAAQATETMQENPPSFQMELTAVGKKIAEDLKAIPEVTSEEARSVRATVQTVVGALARDMRVSPMELWEKYGARILGEPRVRRDAQGNLIVDEGATPNGQQQADTSKGVRGEFFPALKLIARWKNANRSTLLHETGHLFLELRLGAMRDILAFEGPLNRGQQRVLEVGKAILEWAGVDSLEAWEALSESDRKAIHEKWARSYEAYVMEGRAPTRAVAKAFRAFTQMLKVVYTAIVAIPGQSLDDSTRELFDSIFLTSSQVRQAHIQAQGVRFISVEDQGLSPIEGEQYNQALEDMYGQAETEQMERNARLAARAKNLRQAAVRALKAEARGRLKVIRDEIQADAEKTKTWKAWDLLINGREDTTKEPKVDKNGKKRRVFFRPHFFIGDLKALGYSAKQISSLEKAGFTTKQAGSRGVPLVDLANELEYGNEKELVDDMLANLNLKEKLDEKAVERFAAENPLLKNDQAIENAAALSWFNEAKLRALDLEIRMMERQINAQVRTETPAMEAVAREYISRQKLTELKPSVYARAAAIAARNARNAYRKGEVRAAIFFKRQEIYQSALAKSAKEAAQGIGKMREFTKKIADTKKNKWVAPAHLEVMQRIIVACGFSTLEKVGLNPTDETLGEQLLELFVEYGTELEVMGDFVNDLDKRPSEAVSTVGGMAQLYDLLKQLDHAGRYAQHLIIEGKKAELYAVATGLIEAIEANADARGYEEKDNREGTGWKDKAVSTLRAIGFSHARIPSLLAMVEGKREGKFFEAVVSGLDKSGAKAEELKNRYAKRLWKAFEPIMAAVKSSEKKTYKSVGVALTKMQVIAIALNTGNEGNFARLLQNPSTLGLKELSTEQVLALLTEALTAQELQAVQEVWNVFESMRHETEAVAKRITGRAPLWVKETPRTIMSADGVEVTLRGGYYPIVYDRKASGEGARIGEIEDAGDMSSIRNNGGVFDGHTKNRVKKLKNQRPLALTLRGAFEGLDRQIHYVAWAEWVNGAKRLFRKVDPAIRKYWGSEAMDAINQWIEDIRTAGRRHDTQADRLADLLRSNVSLAGVGFNLVTALVQPLGITQSVAILGHRWVMRGVRDFAHYGLFKSRDVVAGMSEMMRNRFETQFRELSEVQAQLNGTTSSFREKMTRAAYVPIVWAQAAVDIPTWFGAYNKALAEGATEERAVALADRAVIDSQGSGRLQDLAGVERGNSWQKLMTVFYTFFNTALNVALVSGYTKKKMQAAVDLLMILVMQPVLESLVRASVSGLSGDEDMDEDWWLDALKKSGRDVVGFNMSLFVGLRELQYVFDEYNAYSGPGGLRKITDTGRLISKTMSSFEEGEWDEKNLQAFFSAFGVWAGVPVVPINRLISGAAAMNRGETENWSTLFLGYNPN